MVKMNKEKKMKKNNENCEYYIYGINRVAKDFIYIFDSINIVGIFDDNSKEGFFSGLPIVGNAKKILKEKNKKIILCDFDKEQKLKMCNYYGLKYGQDFLFERDFFALLNTKFDLPNDKDVVMWGIGREGERIYEKCLKGKIKYCIDSYSDKKSFMGVSIKRPDDVRDWENVFVIITPRQNIAIITFLKEKGLHEGQNYIFADRLTYDCAMLLERTIFDKNSYDLNCETMLNHLEILGGGGTRTCCTTFVDQSIGNISNQPICSVWGNMIHRILALSVENHTYSFCKKDMCPYFIGRDSGYNMNLEKEYKKVEDFPSVVAIGYDASCNLKCATCRNNVYVAKGDEKKELCSISKRLNDEIISKSKFLIMAGNGELFVSEAYRSVFCSDAISYPQCVRILSNGTLFNEKNWNDFKTKVRGKVLATFSIDAASKETYEKIRIGGKFENIVNNMEFASKLRKKGELSYLRLNFVVQNLNYTEMEDFVRWGLKLGVDEVFFTKILNWGTYTDEQFKEISMFEHDGITPKPELQEVLNRPIMRNRIVDLGTIQYAHKKVEGEYFYNYYMWELERKVQGLFEK